MTPISWWLILTVQPYTFPDQIPHILWARDYICELNTSEIGNAEEIPLAAWGVMIT